MTFAPLFDLARSHADQALAEIETRTLAYTDAQGLQMQGYHAVDSRFDGPRPGILLVHEWWGLNDYLRQRCRQLARLGYSVLGVDMYGGGQLAETPDAAQALMQETLQDPAIVRRRFSAALHCLQAQAETDAARIAAAGYCYGGRVVLDMARQGLELAGVVSFHGALDPAIPAEPGRVRARILVEHAGADSMVTAEEVAAFNLEMLRAGADYRLHCHPETRHGFTNPAADLKRPLGLDVAYNPQADHRSWASMALFLSEIFAD